METVDLKLVLLGQPGVGKTCLVYRYLYNTFGETISVRTPLLLLCLGMLVLLRLRGHNKHVHVHGRRHTRLASSSPHRAPPPMLTLLLPPRARPQTIGASFAMKKVETSGRQCNLGIWDTAGQERFDSLSSFYCRGARAAIICYDLTDRQSFECLQQKWIRKVTDEAEAGCHICIVGTKLDLVQAGAASRAVRAEEVEALAAKHRAHVFEASAKQGEGVGEVFATIVSQHHARANADGGGGGGRGGLSVNIQREKSGCC